MLLGTQHFSLFSFNVISLISFYHMAIFFFLVTPHIIFWVSSVLPEPLTYHIMYYGVFKRKKENSRSLSPSMMVRPFLRTQKELIFTTSNMWKYFEWITTSICVLLVLSYHKHWASFLPLKNGFIHAPRFLKESFYVLFVPNSKLIERIFFSI